MTLREETVVEAGSFLSIWFPASEAMATEMYLDLTGLTTSGTPSSKKVKSSRLEGIRERLLLSSTYCPSV